MIAKSVVDDMANGRSEEEEEEEEENSN